MIEDVFFCTIAGLNFRATDEMLGGILGYTEPTPVDVDKNAIGCYLQDGTLIGFIPVKRRDEYLVFEKESSNDKRQCLFAGNIKKAKKQGDNFYIGNIAIVKGDNMEELLKKYYNTDFNLYGGTKPEN
jgi:hypothetical protein